MCGSTREDFIALGYRESLCWEPKGIIKLHPTPPHPPTQDDDDDHDDDDDASEGSSETQVRQRQEK